MVLTPVQHMLCVISLTVNFRYYIRMNIKNNLMGFKLMNDVTVSMVVSRALLNVQPVDICHSTDSNTSLCQ